MKIKNHAANSFQIDHAGIKTTPAEKFLKVVFMATFVIMVILFIGMMVFRSYSIPIGKQDSSIIFTQPLSSSKSSMSSTSEGTIHVYYYSGEIKNISETDYPAINIKVVFTLKNGKQVIEEESFTEFNAGVTKLLSFTVKGTSSVASIKGYAYYGSEEIKIANIKGINGTNTLIAFFISVGFFVIECFIIVGIDKRKRKIRRAMPSNNIVVVDKNGIKDQVQLDTISDASKIVKCIYCGTFNYTENHKCKTCGSLLERSIRNEKDYYQEEE